MNSPNSQFVFNDPKTRALATIISGYANLPLNKVLVVGCGKGIEAAVLGDSLNAHVVGIDIDPGFDVTACEYAELRLGDATCMDFADGEFDVVYSFHALEHIPEYRTALAEMRRVLRAEGTWLIGTPNRDRIVGYLGSKGATVAQKLRWNISDWKARLKGKFRNECGAHAGFSERELSDELSAVFQETTEISLRYYSDVYSTKKTLVQLLATLKISRWVFPAVYFIGRK